MCLTCLAWLMCLTCLAWLMCLTCLRRLMCLTCLAWLMCLTCLAWLMCLTCLTWLNCLTHLAWLNCLTRLAWVNCFTSVMTDVSHLIDDSLHLHMGHLWQRGLEEVHHTLKGITLQDELPMAAQQHQRHLEDHIWALDEDHICSTHTHTQ